MPLRFAIPSKGSLYDGTMGFFDSCGLRIVRPNPRRYTAAIAALPGVEVLLHRPADIVEKVADGEIEIGVSGLDLVEELRGDREDLLVIHDDLGYGRCELVVAVPEAWIDVRSWRDLADLAAELHASGRTLRIATKYAALIRRFCQSHGINAFRIIDSQGATEAAPGLGYADIIADITETGTTLRDNQLKIVGGPILKSQACIIASRRVLRQSPDAMATIQTILEMVEARRRARAVVQITANIAGASVADVGQRIVARPEFAGAQGPTIAPVWPRENGVEGIYMVTMVIPQEHVLATVRHLRAIGGDAIAVMPAHYYFTAQSETFARIVQELA
ncbi:MAG: ATP phosphoribosyltransferase [Chloroflexales bacterium]|nr:ATP phosphoribosyltransferase [Chloroflexales bacterium]